MSIRSISPFLILLIFAALICVLTFSISQAQDDTIPGRLLDTGDNLECYIVTPTPTFTPSQTPLPTATRTLHPVFQTATKLASSPLITPTPKIVSAVSLNVRACPGTSCSIVKTLKQGDIVYTTPNREYIGIWWVQLSDNNWVAEQYLQ